MFASTARKPSSLVAKRVRTSSTTVSQSVRATEKGHSNGRGLCYNAVMYNYAHFKPKEYDFSKFEGPKSGEKAIDFAATKLNGEHVKLSDFFGNWIVLETGSISCPIYESKIKPMNELARKFSDVTFFVLYVREAHPGEKIREHGSFEEKLSCARRARDEDGESRTILVDDVEGSAHRLYGSMPNSVYVIDSKGHVVFRGDWNDIDEVHNVLQARDSIQARPREHYSARPSFRGHKEGMLGTLRRAGWVAVWDFMKAFPVMVFKHIQKLRFQKGKS